MQGATLSGRTILLARNVFTPGQLYVMLSRVTERRLITLAGQLTPAMCQPVVVGDLGLAAAAALAHADPGAGPSGHAGLQNVRVDQPEEAGAPVRKRARIHYEYAADRPDLLPDL